MSVYLENPSFCPRCQRPVLARARGVNHLLHAVLCLLICPPVWLAVWAFAVFFWVPVWWCPWCGGVVQGPGNTMRKAVLWMSAIGAAVFALIVFGGVVYWLASANPDTAAQKPLDRPLAKPMIGK